MTAFLRAVLCATWLTLLLASLSTASAQEDRAVGAVTFEVRAVADRPGPHTRSYLGVEAGPDGKPESVLLSDPPLLDGRAVQFVSLDYDAQAHPRILITLTADGARRFEQITTDMVGKQIGLVIGGQLYSEPRIMEAIHGGKIAISGSFTAREATNLVGRLNAALPGR
ncbi:MAG: hypothetical protein INR65_05520 [Gluconacetobacter diazotrophicus]|nr:hypothetical protein [Gluconacetobacter diazotrophicus]